MTVSRAARLPLFGVLLCLLLVSPSSLRAEDGDAQARGHFEAGRAYFARALYGEAHREFAEAYRLSGRETLLINMSRALEAARDVQGAMAPLELWLSHASPDDPALDDVRNKLMRLRAEAERLSALAAARASEERVGPTAPVVAASAQPAGWLKPTAISLLAGGTALSLGGAALLLVGRSNISSVESPADNATWKSVESDYEQGPRRVAAGIGVLSVGAAALVTGAVVVLLRRRRMTDVRTGQAGSALLLTGRF